MCVVSSRGALRYWRTLEDNGKLGIKPCKNVTMFSFRYGIASIQQPHLVRTAEILHVGSRRCWLTEHLLHKATPLINVLAGVREDLLAPS